MTELCVECIFVLPPVDTPSSTPRDSSQSGKPPPGPASVTDLESLRTEDLEAEYRKSIIRPPASPGRKRTRGKTNCID